jgi:intracellular sulfur oxidation DsrE/DsrF family protein
MSEEDISLVLNAVEEKLADPTVEPAPPIVMMLHGPEARHFLRSNYTKNQSLVDLGAKLAGYGLIDVKICETWMRRNKHDKSELFPFVSTVPFGPSELSRLRKEEDYSEFVLDL